MEYLLVPMTLFAGGSDVFKAAKKTSENEPQSGPPKMSMNENAIVLVRHAIADDPYISISGNNVNMLPFTW